MSEELVERMKAEVSIETCEGRLGARDSLHLRVVTDKGRLGFNFIPLKKKDAQLLSRTLGLKINGVLRNNG